MIRLYRCRICGDPYIGEKKPSRCPFCGAYEKYIADAKDYSETFEVELSEKDRKNSEKALEVEISNSAFYSCASKNAPDDFGKQLFKALSKVEAEHASIWRKILKLPKEAIEPMETCPASLQANLDESHEREARAISFYFRAAAESDAPRVRQIFEALAEVEKDHLEFSGGK